MRDGQTSAELVGLRRARRNRAVLALTISVTAHLALGSRWSAPVLVHRPKVRVTEPIPVRLVDIPLPPPPEEEIGMARERPAVNALERLLPAVSTESLTTAIDGGRGSVTSSGPVGPEPWVPRIERMEVELSRVLPERATLPRRFDLEVPRHVMAPDLAPPAIPPPNPLASVPMGESETAGPWHSSARGPSSSRVAAPDLSRPLMGELWPSERPGEITRAVPIEPLLRMELRTHRLATDSAHIYFEIRIERESPTGLPVMPKDLVLIQDCSESMGQQVVDECKRAWMHILAGLAPGDRFNVLSFAERGERLFENWAPADAAHRARAGWFVEQMMSRGMTDLLSFLDDVADLPREPGRAALAVLVTDGLPTRGQLDNFEIIESFAARNSPAIALFVVGVGRRANRFLVDMLGHRNRGDSRWVEDPRQVGAALRTLATELGRPVLADLEVTVAGEANRQIYPRTLTHLFLDRPIVLYGRVRAGAPRSAIHIRGRSVSGELDMVFVLDWIRATPGGPDIVREWARHRMTALMAEYVRTRRPELLEEWARVGRAYRISLPYLESVALPDSPVRR